MDLLFFAMVREILGMVAERWAALPTGVHATWSLAAEQRECHDGRVLVFALKSFARPLAVQTYPCLLGSGRELWFEWLVSTCDPMGMKTAPYVEVRTWDNSSHRVSDPAAVVDAVWREILATIG